MFLKHYYSNFKPNLYLISNSYAWGASLAVNPVHSYSNEKQEEVLNEFKDWDQDLRSVGEDEAQRKCQYGQLARNDYIEQRNPEYGA